MNQNCVSYTLSALPSCDAVLDMTRHALEICRQPVRIQTVKWKLYQVVDKLLKSRSFLEFRILSDIWWTIPVLGYNFSPVEFIESCNFFLLIRIFSIDEEFISEAKILKCLWKYFGPPISRKYSFKWMPGDHEGKYSIIRAIKEFLLCTFRSPNPSEKHLLFPRYVDLILLVPRVSNVTISTYMKAPLHLLHHVWLGYSDL